MYSFHQTLCNTGVYYWSNLPSNPKKELTLLSYLLCKGQLGQNEFKKCFQLLACQTYCQDKGFGGCVQLGCRVDETAPPTLINLCDLLEDCRNTPCLNPWHCSSRPVAQMEIALPSVESSSSAQIGGRCCHTPTRQLQAASRLPSWNTNCDVLKESKINL